MIEPINNLLIGELVNFTGNTDLVDINIITTISKCYPYKGNVSYTY